MPRQRNTMIRKLSLRLSKAMFVICLLSRTLCAQTPPASPPKADSTVILNARVADGTGKALRKASVRIVGDRIAQIGNFKPEHKDRVVDAKGLVLAPGFIDIHNHSTDGLQTDPLAETQIAQGITSLVVGADGDSPWPILPWLEAQRKTPAAVNVAAMVGHATIREQVMGKDFKRVATSAEMVQMAKLTEQAMQEGAIGLSSGLEYEVGSYSSTDELVLMATTAARNRGFYMTHIRDEGNKSFEALHEEIAIGERAHIPIEHSHIKVSTVAVWGKAPEYVRIIESARKRGVDFLADCYHYDEWHSNIKVIMPDKQYENPQSVEKALADTGGPDTVTITDFKPHPEYASHTIAELPARRLGWKDRGVIREGAFADLVLFDPETVIDRSTFAKPFELPAGIEKVLVNGELVWDADKPTGARPGRVLPK